jgi:hypothetical protein
MKYSTNSSLPWRIEGLTELDITRLTGLGLRKPGLQ